MFRRVVVSLITDWINEAESGTAWREGSARCLLADERARSSRLKPDQLDLCSLDGWTCLESSTRD